MFPVGTEVGTDAFLEQIKQMSMLILMGNCTQGYARICQSDHELNLFSAFS